MKRLKANRTKTTPRYCGPHKTGQAYSIWPTGTPQAIAVIEPWLRPDAPEQYLFQPRENWRRMARTRGWKADAYQKDDPRGYSYGAIWKAIRTACETVGAPPWHTHQLRHLAATRIAQQYGVEVAQILLGHSDVQTTLQYVDPGVLTKDDIQRYRRAIKAVAENG